MNKQEKNKKRRNIHKARLKRGSLITLTLRNDKTGKIICQRDYRYSRTNIPEDEFLDYADYLEDTINEDHWDNDEAYDARFEFSVGDKLHSHRFGIRVQPKHKHFRLNVKPAFEKIWSDLKKYKNEK